MPTTFEIVLGLPLTQLVLVWVLTFTVTYAALLKAKVLGEDHKIIAVIAAVFAFMVAGFGVLVLGNFFSTLFGFSALIIGGLLVTIIFFAMVGGDVTKTLGTNKVLAVIAAISVIIFWVAATPWLRGISNEIVSTILVLIVLIIAVMFVTGNAH